MGQAELVKITVNDIGEYIRHQSCDRRFYLRVHYNNEVRYDPATGRGLPFFDRLLNTLEPVLQKVGREREDQWEKELTDQGFRDAAAGLPRGKHDGVEWQALVTVLVFRHT